MLDVGVQVAAEDDQFGDVDQVRFVGVEPVGAVDDAGEVALCARPGDRSPEAGLGQRVAVDRGFPPGLAVMVDDVLPEVTGVSERGRLLCRCACPCRSSS